MNTAEILVLIGIDYLPTQMEDNTNVTHANDDFIDQSTENSLTILGGDQLPIINSRSLCKLFRILGHCERHARMLNKWSLMESLSERSGVICIAMFCG
ncbi:MAG TPA: hypothetical protein VJN02_04125, partial [Gammaproteobacteria bacterium]|nr:hypothetical protein [Gammaproteobacteria bacterium]